MSNTLRLLAVIAHPDDEATFAGTLARAASDGVEVTVVCTTNGGGGAGSREVGHGVLARTRQQELLDACQVLGVHDVEFYEALDNEPHLDRGNYATTSADHHDRIVARIRDQRPQAVITFGAEGVTGHQTHVQVGALTDRAVRTAGVDLDLYHVGFSRHQVDAIDQWLRADPQLLDAYADEVARTPNLDATPVMFPVDDDLLTASIDVATHLPVKRQALRRHVSQGGGGNILDAFCLSTVEHFTRIGPDGPLGAPGSVTDLFAERLRSSRTAAEVDTDLLAKATTSRPTPTPSRAQTCKEPA